MNQHKPNHQSGYTLLELLFYVAALGILLMALGGFFVSMNEARAKANSMDEVNQQGIAAMEYVTRAIRNASAITAPAAGSSAAELTLASDTASQNPTVINLSGTTLQTTEGAASAVALTNSNVQVTSLSFANDSRASTAGVVQVTMTITRVNSSGRNPYAYEKTFTATAAVRY